MLCAEKPAMKMSSVAHRVFAHGGSRQEGSSDVPGGGTKKGRRASLRTGLAWCRRQPCMDIASTRCLLVRCPVNLESVRLFHAPQSDLTVHATPATQRWPTRSFRSKSAPSLYHEWPISPQASPAIDCGGDHSNRLWRCSCKLMSEGTT